MADVPPLVAILAAGAGSRFGGGKLDAMCAGKPVGQWVLDAVAAAGLPPGVIVVGEDIPAFAEASGWNLLVNARSGEGLGTSIGRAARRAWDERRALLVLLADMPLVPPSHIAALAKARGVAATGWPDGRSGVPAAFSLDCLGDLADLGGDEGAGRLLRDTRDKVTIPLPADSLLDVDTAKDLARAEVMLLNRRG